MSEKEKNLKSGGGCVGGANFLPQEESTVTELKTPPTQVSVNAQNYTRGGDYKVQRMVLNTPDAVRRYMQRIIIEVLNDDMDVTKGRLLIQAGESVLKTLDKSNQQAKLLELEEKIAEIIEDDNVW